LKNTVFIGDIHGDLEFLQFIDKQYEEWDKVFVGDYLDSWYFPPRTCIECLNHILQMVERGDTQALLGNHELSYLFEGNRCSGWSSTTEMMIIHLRTKALRLLKYFIWIPEQKILITHGGVTLPLWQEEGLTVGNVEHRLMGWMRDDIRDSKFGWVGKARGGIAPYGGPFWCDYDNEFKPVFGITQIFGHTPHRSIVQVGSNYDLNQLEMMATREVLEWKDDAFQVAKFSVQKERNPENWETQFQKLSPAAQDAFKNLQERIDR
jgi:Calcineurin-like phosphoesterase